MRSEGIISRSTRNKEFAELELRVQLTPLEQSRVRSRALFGVSSQRHWFLGISITLSTIAAFSAFALNDGFAAIIWALAMFLFVPLILWYITGSPAKALGGAGLAEVISASVSDLVYRIENDDLVEVSGGTVRRFSIRSLIRCELKSGELTLEFPSSMITIPAGSANKEDIRRFAKTLEDHVTF